MLIKRAYVGIRYWMLRTDYVVFGNLDWSLCLGRENNKPGNKSLNTRYFCIHCELHPN